MVDRQIERKPGPELFEFSDVTLVRAKTSDANRLYEVYDREREFLAQTLDWAAGITLERMKRDFVTVDYTSESGEWLNYWIEQDGKVIGGVGGIIDENQTLQFGYWLIESATGKGIVTRVSQKVIDFAFQEAGVELIKLEIKSDNYSSQRVAEQLGAINTGEQAVRTTDGITSTFDIWEISKP